MSVGIMDLSPVMALLTTDILTVTRNTSTFNMHGVAIPGAPSSVISFPCNIQPITAKDLERLPEGQRVEAAIVVFTRDELRIANTPATQSDQLSFRGQAYKLVHSEQWDGYGFPGYWRSILVKMEV